VLNVFEEESKLALSERYIHQHYVEDSEDGDGRVKVIVTMVPAFANLIVNGRAILVDTTFKRVFGEFFEWEIVLWFDYTQQRVTVARIYHNRETRQAYRLAFRGLHSTVKFITGQDIKYRALHGSGLHGIAMDALTAQAAALGDVLLELGNFLPSIPQEHKEPYTIIQYVYRMCIIHFNRFGNFAL
jgi:hypothetical protein